MAQVLLKVIIWLLGKHMYNIESCMLIWHGEKYNRKWFLCIQKWLPAAILWNRNYLKLTISVFNIWSKMYFMSSLIHIQT